MIGLSCSFYPISHRQVCRPIGKRTPGTVCIIASPRTSKKRSTQQGCECKCIDTLQLSLPGQWVRRTSLLSSHHPRHPSLPCVVHDSDWLPSGTSDSVVAWSYHSLLCVLMKHHGGWKKQGDLFSVEKMIRHVARPSAGRLAPLLLRHLWLVCFPRLGFTLRVELLAPCIAVGARRASPILLLGPGDLLIPLCLIYTRSPNWMNSINEEFLAAAQRPAHRIRIESKKKKTSAPTTSRTTYSSSICALSPSGK